jgi:hypothetical protein
VAIVLNASSSSVASANVKCWRETIAGGAPVASNTYLEVLKVATATSAPVSG